MNKLLLALVLLLLILSAVNTALLVEMGSKMKETGAKVDAASKTLDKIQPVIEALEKKGELLPPLKLPLPIP